MNKSKISITTILKYLRELSIIIIGIVITVGFGLWVNKNNIKKDQKQYVYAIILELKENVENFENYAKSLQKLVGYSNYVKSHDEKSINRDSINYYAFSSQDEIGWGSWDPVTLYNEDAFDMFKSSGTMGHIDDKELLLTIWRVYHIMKSSQNEIDYCLQYKKELGMDFLKKIDNGEKVIVPIKWFYINDVPQFMVNNCENTAEIIKETISKLEKSKIVK